MAALRRVSLAAVVALASLSAVGPARSAAAGIPTATAPCGVTTTPPAAWHHVVWIVMENHSYPEVIGSSAAPYVNTLASACGLATNYLGVSHPSLPNYVAMTSGGTQGITDDNPPPSHPLAVASIFSQLGLGSWRALEESMTTTCQQSDGGQYAVRHDPAAYYTGITTQCDVQDVPLAPVPDLSAPFTFITPNVCDDMHDCSVATGDSWLSGEMQRIVATPQYLEGDTAVFVTWDEDDGTAGNHVPFLVVAPSVVPGTTSGTAMDHYAMLRTTEAMLGLGFLGTAAVAPDFRYAFNLA